MTQFQKIRSLAVSVFLLAGVLWTAPAAHAQEDAPSVRRNNVEIAAFGGASLGFEEYRFMGGGNVGWAATKHIFPYFEFSYLPGLTREQDLTAAGDLTLRRRFEVPAYDYNGGLHLRAPIAESAVVPYAVIGFGGIRYGSSSEIELVDGAGNVVDRAQLDIAGQSVSAVNGGGGVRFYANEDVGFRFEFKVYKPISGDFINKDPFYRFTGAIFFQIN